MTILLVTIDIVNSIIKDSGSNYFNREGDRYYINTEYTMYGTTIQRRNVTKYLSNDNKKQIDKIINNNNNKGNPGVFLSIKDETFVQGENMVGHEVAKAFRFALLFLAVMMIGLCSTLYASARKHSTSFDNQ